MTQRMERGERQREKTHQTSAPKPGVPRHALFIRSMTTAKLLNGDANQRAQQSANGGNKLGTHGRALREARLDKEGKVADLMGDLVEEDGHGGGRANGRGGVETSRHGQAVGNVVRKVGTSAHGQSKVHENKTGRGVSTRRIDDIHQVQVAAQLDARVDLLLIGSILLIAVAVAVVGLLALALLLARLGIAIRRNLRAGALALRLIVNAMGMTMRVIVAGTTSGDSQPFIHCNKDHEPNENAQSQDQVPVRLNKHKPDPVGLVLAEEDLRQKVEQGIAEETADGEGYHDGERGGINVGRAQGEEEVRRAGDVQRGQQRVDSGRARKQHGEEARGERRRRSGMVGELGGVEILDNGAGLSRGKRSSC